MTASPPPTRFDGLPQNALRVRAAVLLVLVILELLVGNQLALAGSPYPVPYLAGHVVLAILLVGLAAHSTILARRRAGAVAQVSGLLALLGSAGAGIAGTIFLWGGQANGALWGMEGLGVIALLGAILLLVFGSLRPASSTGPPPSA
jgi:hypothetical protein